jgi:hypothetical protein
MVEAGSTTYAGATSRDTCAANVPASETATATHWRATHAGTAATHAGTAATHAGAAATHVAATTAAVAATTTLTKRRGGTKRQRASQDECCHK